MAKGACKRKEGILEGCHWCELFSCLTREAEVKEEEEEEEEEEEDDDDDDDDDEGEEEEEEEKKKKKKKKEGGEENEDKEEDEAHDQDASTRKKKGKKGKKAKKESEEYALYIFSKVPVHGTHSRCPHPAHIAITFSFHGMHGGPLDSEMMSCNQSLTDVRKWRGWHHTN